MRHKYGCGAGMCSAHSGHSPDSHIGQDWEFHNSSLGMRDLRLCMTGKRRHRGGGRGKQCFQKTSLAKVNRAKGSGTDAGGGKTSSQATAKLQQNWTGTLVTRNMEGTDWKDFQKKQNKNLSSFGN